MVTANELLASVMETDRTFIIDSDLRTIKIPANITNLGVQSDDDVMTVYFQMPGTYCGVNLSEFNIRINYLNAAGEGDYHDVDDAAVQSDGTIRFSWTIGRHAASVVGTVEFNVCLKKSDSSGNVIKEFNTTTASLPILKGLEISEQVISEYNDILEQWRAKLFGVGDTEEARILAVSQEQQQVISEQSAMVLSDIELKGSETLKTIPGTYTEVYNMAEEALRTKADAIVLEAEGTVIAVNDASDDHLQNLKLFGRTTQAKTTGSNLFDEQPRFGAYDDSTGEHVEKSHMICSANPIVVTGGTRYYNCSNNTYPLYYFFYDINGNFLSPRYACGTGEYITAPSGATSMHVNISSSYGNVYKNDICIATDKISYEPYTGGKPGPNPDYPLDLVSVENPSVNIYGKNIIPYPYINNSVVSNGITFTANGDGSVTANGTATGTAYFPLQSISSYSDVTPLPRGEYVLSGAPIEYCRVAIGIWKNGKRANTHSAYAKQPFSIVIDEDDVRFDIVCTVDTGVTLNNAVFKPQLELGSTATEYEPYVEAQPLTLSRTLPGIPVTSGGNYTDENGQQWICDEVDFDRGVYVQRVGIKQFNVATSFLGTSRVDGSGVFYSALDGYDKLNANLSMLSDKMRFVGSMGYNSHATDTMQHGEFAYICNHEANARIYFAVANVSSDEEATVWLANNVPMLFYPLATPIETPLTSEELLAYKALKTNRTNTTVLNDQNAHMAIAYSADTLIFLRDNQPKPTDEQMTEAIHSYLDEAGVELIPGPKGDKGDKGDPGDDYVLTEADKTEMVNAVMSALPTWEGGSY